ncbi:unnamed protein product [Cyprideis torosa]|uniref:Integrin alpha-2 domain-containing protein n=1 Tax=Cyprideis torosa TaxID=163714 RepID=A0A7R8ZRF0_9CRUS|nr:unnamed protein product [Cyprideis torosa]CAG0892897.1 unnamed protein product [Cyprideis torosa]
MKVKEGRINPPIGSTSSVPDFAVSAPYDGNGVVFIHHGSALGVQKRPSQVIRDSDVSPGRPLPTFGFSISGGQDLDFNQYPDLLIGAYKASTAVYIRARPVVHVKAYLKFAPGTEYVDLDAKTCEDKSVEGTCVTLQLCVEYEGVGVANSIVLQTEYELDARKQKNPRLFFYDRQDLRSRSEPMALRRKEEQCRNITTYLKSSLRDKLTPIAATVNFQLFEKGRHCIDGLCPVLGPAGQLEDAIVIKKNCGPDNTCVPDLRVSHVLKEQTFLLGSGKNIEIDVTVANMGEDAYEAVAYLTLPPGVSFIKVERASDSADLPISCTPDRRTNILNCEIANPLPEYKQAERLQKQIEFELSVNSTNTELAGREDDNYGTIVIPIRVKTELLLSGTMEPETVTYNRSNFLTEGHEHETQIGPQIIHRYFIENKGPSTITEAEAIILWPSYAFSEDEPLLYLMEQPHTEGEGACQRVPNVNPMKIRLTTPTERRRALEGKNSFMTSPHQNLIPEEDEEDQKDTGRRLTRSADAQDTEQRNMNLEDYEREASDCGKSKNCTVIRCTAGPLRAGDRFAIALRSRLWINTLSQLSYGRMPLPSIPSAKELEKSLLLYLSELVSSLLLYLNWSHLCCST